MRCLFSMDKFRSRQVSHKYRLLLSHLVTCLIRNIILAITLDICCTLTLPKKSYFSFLDICIVHPGLFVCLLFLFLSRTACVWEMFWSFLCRKPTRREWRRKVIRWSRGTVTNSVCVYLPVFISFLQVSWHERWHGWSYIVLPNVYFEHCRQERKKESTWR